jgi:CheY-like chemotaxis protein
VSLVSDFSGHVLIIEDEPIIAIELEILLGELGYRSFTVADTPEGALSSAREHRPDLITADYRIVAGTGVEAVRLITAALGRIPVVYVTGNPDVLADEPKPSVVDKPISPTALRRACEFATGAPN